MSGILLGVVADDFTGASDAASFAVQGGLRTVLFNGVPGGKGREAASLSGLDREADSLSGRDSQAVNLGDAQVVVIALKTRTVDPKVAAERSLEAFQWLEDHGARHLYFKYCSTFDSTDRGNIGPVADAVMEKFGFAYTLLCPSLPVNGRTVRDGKLYVNGVLLHESHMKDHPLTPMRDCRIDALMSRQGRYPCVEIGREETAGGEGERKLSRAARQSGHAYGVPDYETDGDGAGIARAFAHLPFLTGGSGLVGELSRVYREQEKSQSAGAREARENACAAAPVSGRAILLAGSCSAMTLRQIQHYIQAGGPTVQLIPEEILAGHQTIDTVWEQARRLEGAPLIYSSAGPAEVEASQRLGRERVAAAIEELFAGLARRAVAEGVTRVICAGGETSGAVTRAFGFSGYGIGPSVAPGVPVMAPLGQSGLRLVLKSGNFGQEDFFLRALAMTGQEEKAHG